MAPSAPAAALTFDITRSMSDEHIVGVYLEADVISELCQHQFLVSRLSDEERDDMELSDKRQHRKKREAILNKLPEEKKESILDEIDNIGWDQWAENNTVGEFRAVTRQEVMGEKYIRKTLIPPGLAQHQGSAQNATLKIVPNQNDIPSGVKTALQAPAAADLLKSGDVHPSVVLGAVNSTDHPQWKVMNAIKSPPDDAYAVFAKDAIPAGTVIGFFTGKLLEGSDFDQQAASDVSNLMRGLSCFEMNGSLKSHGGWIDDTRLDDASMGVLVLDHSVSNEMNFIADFRDKPFEAPEAGSTLRKANTKFVEVTLRKIPHIAVVTTRSVKKNDELIGDYGMHHWTVGKTTLTKAQHVTGLNTQLNKMLSKIEVLEDEQNPLILEHRESKEQEAQARAAAVLVQEIWDDAEEAEEESDEEDKFQMIPVHQPGTLDAEVFKAKFSGSVQEDKAPEIQAELQADAFDDSFRPLTVKSVQNKDIWVENTECARYLIIKQKYGEEIASEVRRAWQEMQNHQYKSASTRLVPWHAKESRPLTTSEIIMLLAIRCIKAAEKEDEIFEEEDSSLNKALRSAADEVADDSADVVEVTNREDGARLRLKKSLKRLYTDYKDISKELPLPKRGKGN